MQNKHFINYKVKKKKKKKWEDHEMKNTNPRVSVNFVICVIKTLEPKV